MPKTLVVVSLSHLGGRVGGDGADELEADVVLVVGEGVPARHQGRV